MRTYPTAKQVDDIVGAAAHIVIVQADNLDADSLGSALALEHLLGDTGKHISLYCATDVPGYLRYLEGWDRVTKDLPKQFDASIIVDASSYTLFEKLQSTGEMSWLAAKPSIVLDHHSTVENKLDFAQATVYDDNSSSTGELIYHLAKQLSWPMSVAAGNTIMTAILSDTQGLSNELASAESYRVMAELVDLGVQRPLLEEQRRELGKMQLEIFKYKARLIERTEFTADDRIAHVSVPQDEINEFSPLYNPVPLIQSDMLQVAGVGVAIVFKQYDDGHMTGAIRANPGFNIAATLAEKMGGGGHPYASGFKVAQGRPFNEVKSECIGHATQLLNNLIKEHSDEALQHAEQKS